MGSVRITLEQYAKENDMEYLLKEWHYNKNDTMTPSDITYGSGKKVWWQCSKGHEWEATVAKRTVMKRCCPYCCNNKVLAGYNDLHTKNPELAKQWHPTKNGNLTPRDVTYGSGKKFWWKCSKGHEWQASIKKRSIGRGCHYCSGHKVLKGETDLATLEPELSKEWHPSKNGNITPSDVSRYSKKKVWWKCNKGHEWQADICKRSLGRGCPICNKSKQSSLPEKVIYYYMKQVFKNAIANFKPVWLSGYELDIFIPELNLGIEYDGKAFHQNKDNDETKNKLCFENNIKLIRVRETKCVKLEKDYMTFTLNQLSGNEKNLEENILEIINIINKRFKLDVSVDVNIGRDRSCIYDLMEYQELENSIAVTHTHLVKQWHPTKNGSLKPTDVSKGSEKKVWWICSNGHSWLASIDTRARGNTNCPYCAGSKVLEGFNDLTTTHPSHASEWHPTKNGHLKPTQVSKGQVKKVWWKCRYCNEDYERRIDGKIRLKGCPICKTKYSK